MRTERPLKLYKQSALQRKWLLLMKSEREHETAIKSYFFRSVAREMYKSKVCLWSTRKKWMFLIL